MRVGLFEPMQFKFVISFEETTDCEAWIADNLVGKISDVRSSLGSALERTDCEGATLPCVANSQFVCGSNPSIINYE